VILTDLDVYSDSIMGLSANCTPIAPEDTPTKLTPGNRLVCTANVSLTQNDLEQGDPVNITAFASSGNLPSTGQMVTAQAQQPVQLLPNPTLQLDLDILADTCKVRTANLTGVSSD
jgi:hypothetical protein